MIRKCTCSPKENTLADWFEIGFLSHDGNTELARAVDVMPMARLKRIYTIYEIKKNGCSPRFYRIIETRVEVWENSRKMLLFFSKFHSCLTNSVDVNTKNRFSLLNK